MNETKKNTGLKLVVVALVIALCIAYVKIHNLESIIRNLRSDMNTSVSMLEDRVNSIYSNVDAFLKEEASLLSSVSAEYGELNLEDHTIGVTVSFAYSDRLRSSYRYRSGTRMGCYYDRRCRVCQSFWRTRYIL